MAPRPSPMQTTRTARPRPLVGTRAATPTEVALAAQGRRPGLTRPL